MRLDHLRTHDLNLLVVLQALLEERSTTRAAARLGLTQSATSRALQRLRDQLGDPLFVRGPGGLVPTAHAEAIGGKLRVVLDSAADLMEPAAFDPTTAHRAFVVGMADLSEIWLMPRLAAALTTHAPNVDVASFAEAGPLDVGLEAGRFDLIIMPRVPTAASLRCQALTAEDFVCLLRRDHPALSKPWSAKRFAALEHALIAPGGTAGGLVDVELAKLGLTRRVVVRVGTFSVGPEVVARTDLVLTLPRSYAQLAAERLDLVMREPPFKMPGFSLYQCWHERVHHDPGHMWLRNLVHEVATAEAVSRRR
jgi:DNA-binding transcriptional LysR family regulator